jgi:hypothetical protein
LDEVHAEIAELRAILDEALEAMTAKAPTPRALSSWHSFA